VVTLPSITYEIEFINGKREMIYSPSLFPDDHMVKTIFEPWVKARILTPNDYVGNIMQKLFDHEASVTSSDNFGDNRTTLFIEMPLRELMRNFFDELKSTTSGYASISYEMIGMREADVVRLDVLVADEPVQAFARVVARRRVEIDAEEMVEKLYKIIPKQMFNFKVQAKAMGRILSSRTLSGIKKDVTDYLYGGDITRKMKLREKQKRGKKRMKETGKVNLDHDVFLKMIKSE
jgi:GTP-binding protein LepA